MSKTSVEERTFIIERMQNLSDELELDGRILVESYAELRTVLGLDEDEWSLTRLRRVTGSLHHTRRDLKISRNGELMRSEFQPRGYVFMMRTSSAA